MIIFITVLILLSFSFKHYRLHYTSSGCCFFFTDPAAPPAPVIEASSSSVSVGSNLQVTCIVVGEQDVTVEFTWEYPGQTVLKPTVG